MKLKRFTLLLVALMITFTMITTTSVAATIQEKCIKHYSKVLTRKTYIKKNEESWIEHESDSFTLCDINGDDVSELIVQMRPNAYSGEDWGYLYIYDQDENKFVKSKFYGDIEYCGNGYCSTACGAAVGSQGALYKLGNNNKLKEIGGWCEGSLVGFYAYLNKKEVSQKKYEKFVEKLNMGDWVNTYEISKANIKKQLQ